MKRGYKRLLFFQFVLLIFLLLNSFVSSILSKYILVLGLVGTLIAFKIFFGFEKDRHRYVKDLLLDILIFLIVFFLLYYIFGIVITFAEVGNYYTFKGFRDILLPLGLSIVLKEFLRYQMLTKSEGSKILIATTCILFIFLDISNSIYFSRFDSSYNIFLFIALYLLPAISSNLAFTYITIKSGYKPVLLYEFVISYYGYLLPIIPNADEFIYSVIMLILPALLVYRVYLFFEKAKDKDVERKEKNRSLVPLIVPTIIVVVCVYFVSGYFHYHAIAIASGSMSPKIKKGDVVIVEKIDGKYDALKEGQVIAFKHDGIMVVHRLIRIVENDGVFYFYTQGDANDNEDGYPVLQDDVYGIVNVKVGYIGIPTVWLNELL